jgi:alpha-acetolactate decarboxylase
VLKVACVAVCLGLLPNCSRSRPPEPFIPDVRVWGALRAIMHEGKTGPTVSLAEAAGLHVYGVGALSALRGEILLIDGVAFTSIAQGGGVLVQKSTTETATLLVTAAVTAWKSVPISSPIGAEDLDDRLEGLARANGLDVEKAFPLVIDGSLVDVEWHVLDGAAGAPGESHADHMRNAITGKLAATPATVVGFFSKHHEGVFTHMGQRTHFHVMTTDQKLMGHVDRLAVRAGGTLKLPARTP